MFPTLFRFGGFSLATYGLFVAAGYMAGILWLSSAQKRIGLSERQFWGLIYALFFGAVFGGKILYWIVEWRDVLSGELRLIRDFRFGFVFYGGLLGGALMGAWYLIACAMASSLSGALAASLTSVPKIMINNQTALLHIYHSGFMKMGFIGVGTTILAFIIGPYVKRIANL